MHSVHSSVMLSLPSTWAVGGQHREGGIPQFSGHEPQRTPSPPSGISLLLISLCSLLSRRGPQGLELSPDLTQPHA